MYALQWSCIALLTICLHDTATTILHSRDWSPDCFLLSYPSASHPPYHAVDIGEQRRKGTLSSVVNEPKRPC